VRREVVVVVVVGVVGLWVWGWMGWACEHGAAHVMQHAEAALPHQIAHA
jgi:hypothetical protein